jgi:peroxisomal 3,2-trans-enoyl-CoA isomerase
MASPSIFEVEYRGRVAVITINNEKKLNAMTGQQYYELAQLMREVATHDEVYITFLTGKGRYFSASVSLPLPHPTPSYPLTLI